MKKRTKAYYRYQRNKHIQRKKNIIKKKNCWHVKFDGMLSKGKIHCSCYMCAFSGESVSDFRKKDSLRFRELDYSVYD